MKQTAFAAALLAAGIVTSLGTVASADAPAWVERRVVPDSKIAGSLDLGFGLGSNVRREGPNDIRYTGVGWNIEGAISFLRRIEIGLRVGLRAPNPGGEIAQADSFARPFDRNSLYGAGYGLDTFSNPELRVRGKLVDTGGFELALEGRIVAPFAQPHYFYHYFGVPMAFHAGIFRADIQPGIGLGFSNPLFFVLSVPVNLWFQVTRKVFLGPLTGVRVYDRDYYNGLPGGGPFDIMLGFGVGVSFTPWFDLKSQFLFERINGGAQWFGAGVAAGFNFGKGY
ncbi:hypothetical protein BH09MYX1_BH09MYX1_27010 [soil metagenome]